MKTPEHKRQGRTRARKPRSIIVAGAKGCSKPKPTTIKFQTQSRRDPNTEYLSQVRSLERAIKAARGSLALQTALPNRQLKLAGVHKDWVVNGMGFDRRLANLGFFISGSDDHQRSTKARRIWETAEALERTARKNQRQPIL